MVSFTHGGKSAGSTPPFTFTFHGSKLFQFLVFAQCIEIVSACIVPCHLEHHSQICTALEIRGRHIPLVLFLPTAEYRTHGCQNNQLLFFCVIPQRLQNLLGNRRMTKPLDDGCLTCILWRKQHCKRVERCRCLPILALERYVCIDTKMGLFGCNLNKNDS